MFKEVAHDIGRYIVTSLPEQFQDLETIVANTDFDCF